MHDLTGFEGRCDAVLFCNDETFVPPSKSDELTAFRRKLRGTEKVYNSGKYDLVVVGGGIAGTCAAVSPARNGLKVALIQDRPVLGGNNSSEVRVWLQGAHSKDPWPRVGDVVAELEASIISIPEACFPHLKGRSAIQRLVYDLWRMTFDVGIFVNS